MAAGFRAEAATVLLSPSTPIAVLSATTTSQQQQQRPSSSSTESQESLRRHEYTGLWIERLDELVGVLEGGFVEGERGGGMVG